MTQFDLSKIRSSSLLPGLQDLGSVTNSKSFSGTIPVNSHLSTTLSLSFPRNDVISLVKFNILGEGIDSYWFPITGALGLFSSDHKFYVQITVQSATGGRQLNFAFANNTVGSTVTLPALTLTATAHMYSFPW